MTFYIFNILIFDINKINTNLVHFPKLSVCCEDTLVLREKIKTFSSNTALPDVNTAVMSSRHHHFFFVSLPPSG